MKITSLDIRKKSFEKVTFGGYSKEEVHAFLNSLSQAWDQLSAQNRDLEKRLADATAELNRLRNLEVSFIEHINRLEESNHQLRENAKKEAELLLHETRIKAHQLLEEARLKAKAMIKETNHHTYQSLCQMREELRKLDYTCRLLEKYRNTLLQEIKHLIGQIKEKIEPLENVKRNVVYEEEIRRANELMQQQNQSARQFLKEIDDSFAPTESTLQTHLASNDSPTADPLKETSSFFDSLT
ncbi:MAG: DivIVA domain-containing protein [Cytophagales bacterium]|nr:DivIVA domain-containing protein [Bernardetiaceae bacterium]MDW8210472.1 DivIVA domain-containing protein [Cytophagales bacterium]